MSTELFSTLPYKVADITLADFGRKEIDLAEKEMPWQILHLLISDARKSIWQKKKCPA